MAMIRVCMAVWLVLTYLVLPGNGAFAADSKSTFTPETNQDLLPKILQGTHKAYGSIRSGKGRVVRQVTLYHPDGKVLQKYKMVEDVVFSGGKFKDVTQQTILENNPSPEVARRPFPAGHIIKHHLSDDGIQITTFRPDKGGYAAILASDPRRLRSVAGSGVWFDVRMRGDRGMIDLSKYGADRPKEDIIESPKIIGRETIDGDDCLVVEAAFTRSSSKGSIRNIKQYWVDPNKGFAIVRWKAWNEGTPYKERTLHGDRSIRFREYVDGVWATDKEVSDEYNYDQKTGVNSLYVHCETTYDPDFQVNTPVSDSDLKLTLPSGTTVTNEILDAKYTIP